MVGDTFISFADLSETSFLFMFEWTRFAAIFGHLQNNSTPLHDANATFL